MATSSSKESSAARVAYAAARAGGERGASERVTPLRRDALRSASAPLREIGPRATGTTTTTTPTLPVMATVGDVRELVRLLKKRPAGLTLVAAMNSEQKRIFDPRKIAAYEFWGVVSRDGERIRLTALGAEIARQLEPEARIYRTVLDQIIFYRSALEWVFRQGLDLVTHLDVAAYWQEQYPQLIDEQDEKTVEGNVVCFFHLCQAAELGTMTIGKRGQPARLHVERKELSEFITTPAALAPTLQETPQKPATEREAGPADQSHTRLFISHGKSVEVVEQIRVALELAGVESEAVERTRAGSGPVAENMLEAMRRCDRAVIVISADDCDTSEAGIASLNQDVLVEIGAAFVFYNRRVLLLCEKEVAVPSNLQSLSRCRFTEGRLTWEDGISLMRAIKELKD